MSRVVHFELAASDPDRLGRFYSDTFGWKITKWEGPMDYWLVETGEEDRGINGGLIRAGAGTQPVVNTIGVDDLDAMIAKVKANGGTIATPKMAIAGIGWLAYAKDPEGLPFGMMEPDENAK